MSKKVFRIQKPKKRRKWDINPATRVEDIQKRYHRSREKEKIDEIVEKDVELAGERAEGRVLGIDYGERRIGLAMSDPLGIIAQGLETLDRSGGQDVMERVSRIVDECAVRKIVVGLPLSLDGSLGPQAEEVLAFVDNLKAYVDIPVATWDERMTTAAAQRAMHEMGQKARGDKGKVDRIAAILILQSYLDRGSEEP